VNQALPTSRKSAIVFTLALSLIAAPAVMAAEISGVVLDAAGEPVPGATVRIDELDRSTVAGADGSFVLDGLDEGRYEIRVVAPGHAMLARFVSVRDTAPAEIEVRLHPVVATETVTVSSSYSMIEPASGSGVSMGREEIENLPHFGDDLYRVIAVLPSTTANDVSSQFSVRGGFSRDNLILLDGLEIYEPYHLKDFEGVFSIFDPRIIGGARLFPGAFAAKYGDRSSGVLDMDTLVPTERSTSLGVSLSNVWFSSAGTFAEGNGSWIASIRRGYLDIILDLAGANEEGEEESPGYMDLFGRLNWWVTPRQSLALNVLFADDTLDLQEMEDDEDIVAETSYGNWYVWATHRAVPTKRLFARTVLAVGHLDRDRDVVGLDHGDSYVIRDIRDTDIFTLKQDWGYELSKRHALEWGFEARQYDTEYDYVSTVEIDRTIPDPRFRDPSGAVDYEDTFDSKYYSAYLSDTFRPTDRLSAQVGLRYEKLTLTEESHVAPRVNLLWNADEKNALNLGWGYVYQSHRPNELDVQDGETAFYDAERAEHWVVGYERKFDRGWSFRAEAYQRETSDPRVRYENLFDPLGQFPEASYDRVRIAPTSTMARGIELFLRGPAGKKFGWWASYVYSEVEDREVENRIDGRDQNRWFDQPHALTVNVNYRPAPKWNLNAVWLFHTGWPTTRVTAELVDGPTGPEIVPVVGPFYEDRLPTYHRLDLRASRTKEYRRSRLVFFADVQNLYGRENLAGYEFDDDSFFVRPDGSVRVTPEKEKWLGIMPSFGVRWEF
jgi:hypothetical protein